MNDRIIIDGKLPDGDLIFYNPITLRNLSGIIPEITIICKRNKQQEFALQILDCSPQLKFEKVNIFGDVTDDDKELWKANVPNGIIDHVGCIFEEVNLNNVHIGIRLNAEHGLIYNITGDMISGDLWQICRNNCSIKKYLLKRSLEVFPYEEYHRDNGQCFTIDNSELSDIIIENGLSTSEMHEWSNPENLQGILFTDCKAINCVISNCKIINGHPIHGITLPESSGCLIKNNLTDSNINIGYNNKNTINNIIKDNVAKDITISDKDSNDIVGNNKYISNYISTGNKMENLIKKYANELNVEDLVLKALIIKESNKWGAFHNDYPIILFEPNKMASELIKEGIDVVKLLEQQPSLKDIISFEKVDKYGTLDTQLKKLNKAKSISVTAAVAACSYGLFQIGAWQWREMGFNSPIEVEELSMTIEGQFQLLGIFLSKVKPKALAAMRVRDWKSLKIYYNGEGKNNWAADIAQIYRRLLADRDPKKTIQKGESRTVNSQVIDIALKTTTAIGAEASSNIVINNNSQQTDLTKTLTEKLNTIEVLKNQTDQIKEIVSKTAEQVTSINKSSFISDGFLTWIIIGIFIISLIPNIRALYTYLHDNGFLKNKYKLSKIFNTLE